MRGFAVAGGFRLDAAAPCRCLNPHHGHCLAASWRSVVAFRETKYVGSHDELNFGAQSHGLFTRCLRLTAVLRAFALVGPPKTRFPLVVSLGEVGLIAH
jgi:hypothetical protein